MTATLPHVDSGNQEWRDSALCAQTDPELFFPDKGESSLTAKQICRQCPVREECLQDALTNLTAMQDQFGVRGGTSPKERGRIRARRNAYRQVRARRDTGASEVNRGTVGRCVHQPLPRQEPA